MTKNTASIQFDEYTLVRAPLDPATGHPYESCSYALFPGIALAQSEPRLIVLLYDSILQQFPDTAMFLYKGRDGADPLLNRKWSERLLTRWRNLGKPTVIMTTPEDKKFFRGILTEIPTVSLYDLLLDCHISGGCSRELYRVSEPAQFGFEPALRELAEGMGAVLYDGEATDAGSAAVAAAGSAFAAGSAPTSGTAADAACGTVDGTTSGAMDGTDPATVVSVSPEDAARIPFLTSSIDVRNAMKKRGFDAVHILELIYGMGPSNEHLAHTHEGHDHDHDAPPQVRERRMSAAEEAATADLFSREKQQQNLQELHDMLLALFWGE